MIFSQLFNQNNLNCRNLYKQPLMRNNYQKSQKSEQSVKISRSKSRNQLAIVTKLKEKESGWNERFHLQNIPEYNYQNQPQSIYLKNKFRIPKGKDKPHNDQRGRKNQISLEKNKVSNRPNPSRNQEKSKQAISKAFSDLKALWYEKGIPQSHMQLMTKIFNRQNNPMKILDDIKLEFSEVSKDISLVQKIMSSIQTRQNCLLKIIDLYDFSEENKLKVIKQFQEKISHLRILTIHCIQCIFQWKQSFQSYLPRDYKIVYYYQNKSYLAKIKQDYQSIKSSKFKDIYLFDSKKMDVFFLNYSLNGKKITNVSKNFIKRIRMCENLLGETQIQKKEQDGSVRTPLINNKSPILEGKDKSSSPIIKDKFTPWKKINVQYGYFLQYFTNSLKKSHFIKSFLPFVQLQKYEEITILQYGQTGEEIILAVDKNSSTRKLVILGIKATIDVLEISLKSLCQYLWEHDNCTEIRMSLVHQKVGEGFSVDIEMQQRIKKVGFRWISVNHSNDVRTTIYSTKRPLNTIVKHQCRNQAYPVIIQHLTILRHYLEDNQKKVLNCCLAGVLEILKFLRINKNSLFEQMCKKNNFSHHLQCLKKIQNYLTKQALKEGVNDFDTIFSYSGLKAFEVDSEEQLNKIFKNVQISPQYIQTYPSYISLLNTSFKFKNITINDNKFTKFFPTKDNQILICESNYPIYLLQTDQDNINFFIIEVQEGFSLDSIDNIFHAMGQQSSFIDEFWLPTFNKSSTYIDQLNLTNRELISTDYKTCLGSLTRKSKVRTKIIRAPFVFGMINKKLLEMLQVPFYCTLVRKSDLL